MKSQLVISLKILLVLTVITGIAYPLLITGISQAFFRNKANGSLIERNGKKIGSELIGQKFDSSIYFWSRPSATDYNTLPSGGSNLGPSSEKLRKLVNRRIAVFDSANMVTGNIIPPEMLFASGSGLDPHISPEAAMLQVDRIARERRFNETEKQNLKNLIVEMTEKPQFGILGEERINVLLLNSELDKLK